jgi:methylene-tetrahydromethanopterin dehydrogenase
MEGANVIVTSRDLGRSTALAQKINTETATERARGVQAASAHEVGEAIKDSHLILSAGAAGVALLPKAALEEFGSNCKVVADINAIPPLGVEGLKPNDENIELMPGVFGIGALAIGTFKNKIEAQLFTRAVESPKGVFDYKIAYEVAKSVVLEKLKKSRDRQTPGESGRNLLPF